MSSVELLEIRDFLAEVPPFSLLDEATLGALVDDLTIRYLRRGSPFPPEGEDEPQCYVLRKGAIEERDDDNLLLAKYAEGDVFDAAGLAAGGGRYRAVEDLLLYCLPSDRLRECRREVPDVDAFFQRTLGEHLRHARHTVADRVMFRPNLMSMPLSSFIARHPVTAPPATSIREVAALMGNQATAAMLVVEDGQLRGIVTDRDLRARCLATGHSPESPISSIMTADPRTLAPEHPAFEALMVMTRRGIDHLPIVENGEIRGMVSTRDLLRWQSANAAHLAMLIRSCEDAAGLPALSAELPELEIQMLAGGATAGQIGQAVSSIADGLASRLLELGQARLGPAPVAFAWLAGGSQGRQEQSTHSDQDNALIIADDYDEAAHGAYFEALARFVNDGLNDCGFRYCPGEIMASNPKWRQPLSQWQDSFRVWIRHTDETLAKVLVNFLDLRLVAGAPELQAAMTRHVVEESRHSERFLAQLVENMLANRPPLGFFRHLVLIASGEHAKTFDIKTRGIIPIVDLARVQALAAGITEVGTVRRLHACVAGHVLSEESASELEEAHEFLGLLRIRHQVEQIREGQPPDNFVDPERLTSLERKHLKDVFAVVGDMQRTLAVRYSAGGVAA
ncbi:MAG: cyclic nucleotide-binding/CBS domain-containing protein [Rhodocyclaceae bacterium]|nr:cyclic nucleotide-binding/CBS domain-containing protein [Rhodocyclaceae bacterium]